MLTNTPKLKSFDIELYPITSNLVTAMNKSNLELDKVQLYVEDYMSATDYHSFLTSKAVTKLNCLNIASTVFIETTQSDIFSAALIASAKNLINLVELDISDCVQDNLNMLITIIKSFRSLERLTFKRMVLNNTSDEELDLTHNTGDCRLKELNLEISSNGAYIKSFKPVNDSFKYILKSSLLLRKFDLSGIITY